MVDGDGGSLRRHARPPNPRRSWSCYCPEASGRNAQLPVAAAAHIEDADDTHHVAVSTFQVIQDDGTKLYLTTIAQTVFMVRKPARRHRGFSV